MKNEVLKCLTERRSIRRYKSEKIDRETLDLIIEAGTYAATGMGRQSPIMIVVEDPVYREKLRRMNAEILGRGDTDPFYGAPTVVIVLADRSVRTCVEDGSLVIGNLMNAAHALGVDSCWIHRAKEEFESEEGKALLAEWGVEGDYVGVGHCILGYRDCDYPEAKERKSDYVRKI